MDLLKNDKICFLSQYNCKMIAKEAYRQIFFSFNTKLVKEVFLMGTSSIELFPILNMRLPWPDMSGGGDKGTFQDPLKANLGIHFFLSQ